MIVTEVKSSAFSDHRGRTLISQGLGQEAAGDFTMAKLVTTTISTCMQHAAAN